jgi:transposase
MPEPLPYLMDQPFLMPVDLRDWLAKDDIVYFISDTIDLLNLSAIVGRAHKTEKRGRRSYHPHLMIKLIVYGFVAKVYSSRNLETATYRRLDFRVLTGDQHPDHATISTFRKKHLGGLSNLFTEVLRLCVEARLVAFETLSVDGTKIQANASIRANRTEKSLEAERERELEFFRQHAQAYMDKADAADAEDDAKEREAAKSKIGQLSPELLDRKSRLEYIDRLLAAHRKEAVERDAGRESKASSDAQKPENSRIKNKGSEASEAGSASADGAEPKSGRAAKEIKVNTTDSDSRIMRDGATKAYVQGYNAQIVVDGESQIIVATAVTQDANDKKQLVPAVKLCFTGWQLWQSRTWAVRPSSFLPMPATTARARSRTRV